MNSNNSFHSFISSGLCAILSGIAILAGIAGMFLSFLSMALADMRDIIAGASGFVAGAILIGAGIISLALLSAKATERSANDEKIQE